MDTTLLAALLDALSDLEHDPDLKAVMFSTTSERALCAGADVNEDLSKEQSVQRMEQFTRLYSAVEAFPLPTVAVCVGNVVGAGAELAAGCDLRVAGDNLKLAWAGAKLGVPVGPARLVPLIGLSKAKELILTGRVVTAAEAETLGLTHRTTAPEQAEDAAKELLSTITGPTDGLRRLKAMFRDLGDDARRTAYENELLLEFQREGAGLPREVRRP